LGDRLKQISIYERMISLEREVAEFLKILGIKWSYEHPVFIWDENKRPRVWAPDFYLKNLEFMLKFVDLKILIMNTEGIY